MVLRKKISLLLVSTLLLSLLSPFFAQNVALADPGQAGIEVAVALGNSSQDVSAFEQDLKTVLQQVYGIPGDRVRVNVFDEANIKATNPANWQTYDHYFDKSYPTNGSVPAGWDNLQGYRPYFYYKEKYTPDANKYFTDISSADESLTGTYYRLKHVYAKDGDVHFLGYSEPAYKDFMLYPDTSQWQKTISFTLSEGKIDVHTLEGAGFLFNTAIDSNGKLNGYLILYDYNDPAQEAEYDENYVVTAYHPNIKLYKLTNVDAAQFHNVNNSTISGLAGVQLLKTKPSQTASSIKNISMDVSSTSLKFVENGLTIYDTARIDQDVQIAVTNGYGFGPLVSYVSHGCTVLTYFTFKNITMTSKNTKPFNDVVREPNWDPGTNRYIVNFTDTVEPDFTKNNDAHSEVLYRLGKDDVHYIGVGNDEPTLREETDKLVQENDGKGAFIPNENYQKTIEAIAGYIAHNLAPSSAVSLPVASIVYTAENGLQSESYDPNGSPLTELWKWRTVGQPDDQWVPGKPDTVSDFVYADGYYLVHLQVANEAQVWSKPDMEYLSQNGLALPVAEFHLSGRVLKHHEGQTSLVLNQDSFHPAGSSIDEYAWTITDSMGNKVYGSDAAEPTVDVSEFPTDTYTVQLKVKSGDNWSSAFTQKATVINDQTAPQIETNAASNKTVTNGVFQIMDIGGSGIQGYRVKKNGGKWSEWVSGTSGFLEAGEWNSYEIEARDNAGNASTLLLSNLTVKDTTPPVLAKATISGEGKYGAVLEATSNENGKLYYVAVPAGAPAPSNQQVKDGQNAAGKPAINGHAALGADTPATVTVTGLTPGTGYDVYAVAEDAAGNLSAPQKIAMTTAELKIPQLSAELSQVKQREVEGRANSTEAGSVYYVLVPKDTAAPNREQIVAGLNGEDKAALKKGSIPLEAGMDATFTVKGLQVETAYDLYAVVRNTDGDAFSDVVKLSFATLDNHRELAEADAAALKIGYAGRDNEQLVTRNVGLPGVGIYGSEITWTSSNPDVISADGEFVKPDANTYVTLTATIRNGKETVTQTFVVRAVADILPPELTLAGETTVSVKQGTLYREPGYTAQDNLDGDLTRLVTVSGYVDTNKPGTYTLVYSVKDATGNVTEVTRTVIVTAAAVSADAVIPAGNGDVVPDRKVDDAIEGAKQQGEPTIVVKVDETVTVGNPVEVELTKEKAQKAADNGLTLTLETRNASIEVPLTQALLDSLPDGSRLKLVCEQVDTAKPGNEPLTANIKSGMGIYQNQIYDFKMVNVQLDASGNVLKEQVIPSYASDRDIKLGMMIGAGIDDQVFMTFYYNEAKVTWEYIRGQYDSASGRMTLLTRHLSIYSVMTMTLEQKRAELLGLMNGGGLTIEEVIAIVEDPDAGFRPAAMETYRDYTPQHRDNVAKELRDDAPYADYTGLLDSFDQIVQAEKDGIASDLIAPVVTLKGDASLTVYVDSAFADPGATAVDDRDGDITSRIIVLGRVDTSKLGDYVLTYTARDQNGNIGRAERRISVVNRPVSVPAKDTLEVVKGKETVKLVELPATGTPVPNDGGMKQIGGAYELTPAASGDKVQVTVAIPYDPTRVGSAEHLSVFYYDETAKAWKSIGGVVDKEKHTVSATLTVAGATKVALMEYTKSFKDIQGHWAQSVIELLASRQILEGDNTGSFHPNMGITRAEFATLVTRLLGLPVKPEETGFADVSAKDWYAPYIAAARNAGLIKGITDTEYEPGRIVSRQEMAAIIMRAYRKTAGTDILPEAAERFIDSGAAGFWAVEEVHEAKALGLVEGRGGDAFKPKSQAQKAEAAVLIYRFLKLLGEI